MPTNLVEADEFTASVTVPEDGDDRNAASVETGFQALTNRTRNLVNRLGALKDQAITWTAWQRFHGGFTSTVGLGLVGNTNDVFYTDDVGALMPRVRTTYIPLDACAHDGEWLVNNVIAHAQAPDGYLRVPIELPTGAFLQRVEAAVLTGGTMSIACEKRTVDGTGTTRASLAEGAGGSGTLGCDVNQPVDRTTSFFATRIRAANAPTPFGGGYGTVSWVRVLWLDPGPRNF